MPRELAVTSPDGVTTKTRLEGESLSLGRSSANELCFPDDVGLSRQHMTIERDGDIWILRDLGSKNGTFLNGARVSGTVRLNPGDRIVASRVVLVYDPAEVDANKTVLFEGTVLARPSEQTVSTTLEHLLQGETKDKSPFAPQWGSAVTALLRAGRELAARRPLPELFTVILDLATEAVSARRGVLMTLEKGQLVAPDVGITRVACCRAVESAYSCCSGQ